jgi:hypothetical protein
VVASTRVDEKMPGTVLDLLGNAAEMKADASESF